MVTEKTLQCEVTSVWGSMGPAQLISMTISEVKSQGFTRTQSIVQDRLRYTEAEHLTQRQ